MGQRLQPANRPLLSPHRSSPPPSLVHAFGRIHASPVPPSHFRPPQASTVDPPTQSLYYRQQGEHDEKRKHETQRKLRNISRFITLTFTPRKCNNDAYGITDGDRKLYTDDLPEIWPKYWARKYEHHGTPWISMNIEFQDFFTDKDIYRKPQAYNLRTMFLFTITLLHVVFGDMISWYQGRWRNSFKL